MVFQTERPVKKNETRGNTACARTVKCEAQKLGSPFSNICKSRGRHARNAHKHHGSLFAPWKQRKTFCLSRRNRSFYADGFPIPSPSYTFCSYVRVTTGTDEFLNPAGARQRRAVEKYEKPSNSWRGGTKFPRITTCTRNYTCVIVQGGKKNLSVATIDEFYTFDLKRERRPFFFFALHSIYHDSRHEDVHFTNFSLTFDLA